MSTEKQTPEPWHLGPRYGIFKGDRRVLEGDGSTTVEERQSIADSLNRDYRHSDSLAGLDPSALPALIKACEAAAIELDPEYARNILRKALAKVKGEAS